jgi:hypothetical protein
MLYLNITNSEVKYFYEKYTLLCCVCHLVQESSMCYDILKLEHLSVNSYSFSPVTGADKRTVNPILVSAVVT